ncbi:hypothetical protein BX661DRAFT_65189 [Kickxella alabastrina]|uniref:uncharacterized protein n=1 Tax=Kickxella alabastrina TaxID=61397 RepID=UPI00221E8E3C|nr:uncharacterized protein BX661DRAFT_65189 [Kickxella alabastrina]KAI7833784.1 hypothetical protein BX661DRAFT_65189 [Kickxella alabastrina]
MCCCCCWWLIRALLVLVIMHTVVRLRVLLERCACGGDVTDVYVYAVDSAVEKTWISYAGVCWGACLGSTATKPLA